MRRGAAVSEKIKLISGPGCPVCVTPSAYIDRLIKLGCEPGKKVAVFGDMLRVPGSEKSLSQAKGMDDTYEQVLEELKKRDDQDMNRPVEPLRQAEDAVLVDSTHLSFDEVVEEILRIVEEKRHG